MENKTGTNKILQYFFLFFFTSSITFSIYSCRQIEDKTSPVNVLSGNGDNGKLSHPDHIIFLWMENKDYTSIIENDSAVYINSLVKKGTLFTNAFAITHPSYPNYVDFFAGASNGIISDDCFYNAELSTPNLFTTLKGAGKTFAWYSEDLPATGSKICAYNNYVAKHNPTTIFTNVPDSANKTFSDFPADFNHLENVVCISPNLVNDMHQGSVKQADDWFKAHLESLVNWCMTHNSVFVIYFDESDTNKDNRIPVIAIGQPVKANFRLETTINHFSWTKTICSMFSAPDSWTDNLRNANIITGCWK